MIARPKAGRTANDRIRNCTPHEAGAMKPCFLTALFLLVRVSTAAETAYMVKGGFEAKAPEGWVAREAWRPPDPSVTFIGLEKEGEFRLVVYKYPAKNPFDMTLKRFIANLKSAQPKPKAVKETVARRTFLVYKAMPVAASPWSKPHFDPDEAVLGPGGGDFSVKNRLHRCRERGAWEQYDWYREAFGKPREIELFRRVFDEAKARLVETCLGAERLRTIKQGLKPDPAVKEPTDADIVRLDREAGEGVEGDREESVYATAGKDGFFVIKYDSPAGRHDRHYPAYLRFLGTFKPL